MDIMGERGLMDFDQDNAYGQEGEALVLRYGELMQKGEARVEVKRKRRRDLKVYVETQQISRHGEGPVVPSGVNATDALLVCYVFADTGWMFIGPTSEWRSAAPAIGVPKEQATAHKGNPTRGFLVDLKLLLDRYMPDGSGWPVPDGGWQETKEIMSRSSSGVAAS